MKRMNSDLTPIQGLYRLAWLLFLAFVLHLSLIHISEPTRPY